MRHTLFLIPAVLVATATAQPPGESDPWKLDELVLVNGSKFVGLILEDTDAGVRFRIVTRKPGRPTVTMTTTFTRSEVARTRKLDDADRKRLADRLAELDPSGRGERARMDALELRAADWNGKKGAGFRYESDYFTLVTGAPDEIARRAAVRLEQLYGAFRRYFPPAHEQSKPTHVLLAPDRLQYQQLVGKPVLNPALYDPAGNRIVCGSDLARLGSELTGSRLHHEQQLASIDKYETEVKKIFKGHKTELDRYLEHANSQRQKVAAADKANDEAFDKATGQLFAVLYHEAFHAYVATFVFPDKDKTRGELPRWLNEGLAQVFETAILEAGELRVDLADPVRLARVREVLKPGGESLLPISELLRSGPETFLAAHAGQKEAAGRAYLTSWAVSVHLLLEKRSVDGDSLVTYLKAVNAGGDPVKSFEAWVGKDVVTYERELAEYFKKLK